MRKTVIPEKFLADGPTMSLLKHPFARLSERQKQLLEHYADKDSVRKYHMMSSICSDLLRKQKRDRTTFITAHLAWDNYEIMPSELKNAFILHGEALKHLFTHLDINVGAVYYIDMIRFYMRRRDYDAPFAVATLDFFSTVVDKYYRPEDGSMTITDDERDFIIKHVSKAFPLLRKQNNAICSSARLSLEQKKALNTIGMVTAWADCSNHNERYVAIFSDIESIEKSVEEIDGGVADEKEVNAYKHLMIRQLFALTLKDSGQGDTLKVIDDLRALRELFDDLREATIPSYLDTYTEIVAKVELAAKEDNEAYRKYKLSMNI